MTDLASALKKIQVEEVDYRSAISESTFVKMGGSVNAIIDDFRSIPMTNIGGKSKSATKAVTYAPGENGVKSIEIQIDHFIPIDMTIKGVGLTGASTAVFTGYQGLRAIDDCNLYYDVKKNGVSVLNARVLLGNVILTEVAPQNLSDAIPETPQFVGIDAEFSDYNPAALVIPTYTSSSFLQDDILSIHLIMEITQTGVIAAITSNTITCDMDLLYTDVYVNKTIVT